MPSVRISKNIKNGVYFITCTIKHWHHLLDKYNRSEILLNSLKYCQKNKGVKFHAWVLMKNHIHLLVEAEDTIGFIRDFKRHTSRELKNSMIVAEPHILEKFVDAKGRFWIWQKTNMPIYIENEKVYLQKMNYIEENPVKKDYVKKPEDWPYSSANPNAPLPLSRFEVG